MKTLPRRDLRESAFRRYEADIARGTRETFILTPVGVTPLTYCARFKDAILGFQRYKYQSFLIPEGFDLSLLTVHETADGRVLIKNRAAVSQTLRKELDRASVEKAVKTKSENPEAPALKVSYSNAEEKAWLLSLEGKYDVATRDNGREIEYY